MIRQTNTIYPSNSKNYKFLNESDKENFNFTNLNYNQNSKFHYDDYRSNYNLLKKNSTVLNPSNTKISEEKSNCLDYVTNIIRPLGLLQNSVKVEYKNFIETINRKHAEALMDCDIFLKNQNSNNFENLNLTVLQQSKENPGQIRFQNGIHFEQEASYKQIQSNEKIYCGNDSVLYMPHYVENSNSMLIETTSRSNSGSEFMSEKSQILEKNCINSQPGFREDAFNSDISCGNLSKIPRDYFLDIWQSLIADEVMNKVNYYSIKKQIDINERMRSILIDWIVNVHFKFNLSSETLFLTVNIIDSYLSQKQVLRTKLQLIGVSALLIACKYEEVICPDIRDFVYVTDRAYLKDEILQTEIEILLTLKFEITLPSPFKFFEILSSYFNFNKIEFNYGNYLLEFFLLDLSINRYPSSLIALAAAYIVMKINNYYNYKELYTLFNMNRNLQCVSSSNTLKDCAREMFFYVKNAPYFSNISSVYTKFCSQKYLSVAELEGCVRNNPISA